MTQASFHGVPELIRINQDRVSGIARFVVAGHNVLDGDRAHQCHPVEIQQSRVDEVTPVDGVEGSVAGELLGQFCAARRGKFLART
jgi:hypothetical protein